MRCAIILYIFSLSLISFLLPISIYHFALICYFANRVIYIFQSAGEFAWNEKTQGIILGAFFLGYVTTNVPGGRMAEKMGGKLIYGLGIFLTAVLTVISPFAAYWGLIPFLVVRVAEGFTEVSVPLLPCNNLHKYTTGI